MPKRLSDDIDHVPINPKPQKKPRKPVPAVWKMPKYDPLPVLREQTYGEPNLPSHINASDPYVIFSLFFTDDILRALA